MLSIQRKWCCFLDHLVVSWIAKLLWMSVGSPSHIRQCQRRRIYYVACKVGCEAGVAGLLMDSCGLDGVGAQLID